MYMKIDIHSKFQRFKYNFLINKGLISQLTRPDVASRHVYDSSLLMSDLKRSFIRYIDFYGAIFLGIDLILIRSNCRSENTGFRV